MSDLTPVDIEAVKVLIAHGRTRIEGCDCGWGMDGSKLGQSHALHVWRELQRTVLPDHDARVRVEMVSDGLAVAATPYGNAAAIARAHGTETVLYTAEGDTDE